MLTLYFAPWSRSVGVHWLLEEIGAPYQRIHIDIRAKEGVPESYREVQPNKKVPAIDHNGTVVTERAAICLYLTENFPDAKLAPPVGSPDRAAFLTWLVYCDSVFDPAVAAHAQGISYRPGNFSFGSYDDMLANVRKRLARSKFLVGDTFTAADTQMASGLFFTINILKAVPNDPVFQDYLGRTLSRPAYQRIMSVEKEIAEAGASSNQAAMP